MQLLYGNNGTNYQTIARSKDMTAEQERRLLEGYLGYDFVQDSAAYSDFSKEPVALTYVTTDLSNTLEQEKILVSKCGRMTNYATPSYYAHFQLLDKSKELYGDNFLELLQRSFIKDVDLAEYEERDIDSFHSLTTEMQISDQALEKEKLIPIVASVLDVADTVSRQVHIVLDAEGDAYNERALEVIASIYKYIPFNVRIRAGFTTYGGVNVGDSSRIKVKLYTREMLDKIGSNVIDLKNMDGEEILKRLPPMAVELARDFVEQDEAERQKWFHIFLRIFQLKSIPVEEHISVFKNLRVWQNEDLEKLKDSIARYAAAEIIKTPESPVFLMFQNIFSARFEKEGFLPRYQDIISKLLKEQDSFEFDNRLKAYIMLGEALNTVKFDAGSFLAWEKTNIIRREEKKYEDKELYGRLVQQYRAVHTMQCGRNKFQQIQMLMEEQLKKYLEQLKAQILQRMAAEKQAVVTFFSVYKFGDKELETVERMYAGIRYKENREVFQKELFHKFEQVFRKWEYFGSISLYQRCQDLIDCYKKYMDEDDVRILKSMAEQKGEIVKTMENLKVIVWGDKLDILKTYQRMADMRAISEGKSVVVPDFILNIGSESFELTREELENLTEFLLVPARNNFGRFEQLAREKGGLSDSIYEVNGYGGEHFSYLIEMAGESRKKQMQVLRYYLEKDILLSSTQARKGLRDMKSDMLFELGITNEENILGAAIQKRLIEDGYIRTKEPSDIHFIGEKRTEGRYSDKSLAYGLGEEKITKNGNEKNERDERKAGERKGESRRTKMPIIILVASLILALMLAAFLFLSRMKEASEPVGTPQSEMDEITVSGQ